MVGSVTGFTAFVTGEVLEWFDIQFLYSTGILLLFSLVLFVGGSLTSPAHDSKSVRAVMWSKRLWQEESIELRETPMWKSYRVQSGLLLLVTLLMVLLFA